MILREEEKCLVINHKQQVPSLSRPATVFALADSPRGPWRGERSGWKTSPLPTRSEVREGQFASIETAKRVGEYLTINNNPGTEGPVQKATEINS